MLMTLSGPSRPPLAGGRPRKLVILLHGLGADGNDLIGLQQYWGRLLPDAEFVSPNAPFPCDMAPYGYQWFSVQDRTPDVVAGRGARRGAVLDAFIDEELQKRGLTDRRRRAGRLFAGHDDVAVRRPAPRARRLPVFSAIPAG